MPRRAQHTDQRIGVKGFVWWVCPNCGALLRTAGALSRHLNYYGDRHTGALPPRFRLRLRDN